MHRSLTSSRGSISLSPYQQKKTQTCTWPLRPLPARPQAGPPTVGAPLVGALAVASPVDPSCPSAALPGSEKVFFAPLRAPSRAFADKKRCSPRPSASSADPKVFFVVLSGPSWIKGVLRAPSRAFADKKRCSPRPSASSADPKVFFVVLGGPSWTKGVLRAPSRAFADKKVFFVVLCGPSWIKGVLRVPSRIDPVEFQTAFPKRQQARITHPPPC